MRGCVLAARVHVDAGLEVWQFDARGFLVGLEIQDREAVIGAIWTNTRLGEPSALCSMVIGRTP